VINKNEVMDAVMEKEDVMFQWAISSCQLSNDGRQTVLKQVIETWIAISGHAFAKQIVE